MSDILNKSPYFASARLWDDGVIQVTDTRKILGKCLRIVTKSMFSSRGNNENFDSPGSATLDQKNYGIFRT